MMNEARFARRPRGCAARRRRHRPRRARPHWVPSPERSAGPQKPNRRRCIRTTGDARVRQRTRALRLARRNQTSVAAREIDDGSRTVCATAMSDVADEARNTTGIEGCGPTPRQRAGLPRGVRLLASECVGAGAGAKRRPDARSASRPLSEGAERPSWGRRSGLRVSDQAFPQDSALAFRRQQPDAPRQPGALAWRRAAPRRGQRTVSPTSTVRASRARGPAASPGTCGCAAPAGSPRSTADTPRRPRARG